VAKEHFRSWKPYPHSVERLEKVQAIIAEYKAQDLTLSLRQIFYQFVARDWLKNNMAGYQAIKELLIRAREAGEIDWDDMEDRTRERVCPITYADTAELIRNAYWYAEDLWLGQPNRVEVLIETNGRCPICRCAETSQSPSSTAPPNAISGGSRRGFIPSCCCWPITTPLAISCRGPCQH
jgi:hypothetical protein